MGEDIMFPGSDTYRMVELIGLSLYVGYVCLVIWWLLSQEVMEQTA